MYHNQSHDRGKFIQSELDSLSPEEKAYFEQCMAELEDNGNSDSYQAVVEPDWKYEPPTFEEWITDPYFAGTRGLHLYPLIRDELEEIFDKDYGEIILGGSIGWGKSYAAGFGMAYDFTRMACLRNPHEFCGIDPRTDLVILNHSVTSAQAEGGLYTYVKDVISDMPFFKDKYPKYDFEKYGPKLFDEKIILKSGGSTEFGAIGQNVVGAALDEANFMVSVRKSARARMAGDTDQARVLYNQLARRRESRFVGKKPPARLWLISSSQFPGEFLEERIKSGMSNPDVKIIHHNAWDTRKSSPLHRDRYSGKNFLLFIGNKTNRSKIIAEDSSEADRSVVDVPPGCELIDVPVEHRITFRDDLTGAIRDLAGIATLSINPLFENIDKVRECVCLEELGDIPRMHPFKVDVSNNLSVDVIDFTKFPLNLTPGHVSPKLNPMRRRVAHVDLSETGDALGLSIGHYAGHVDRTKIIEAPCADGKFEFKKLVEARPTTIMDVMMKFTPPVGGRLDIAMARMILIAFSKICGFKYELITFDQYQSSESINALNQMGITSERYSVDRTDEAYLMLHSAIQQKRISFYDYEPLYDDCGSLQHDLVKNKVDHIPTGTKDLSDTVAACVRHIEILHPRTTRALGPVKGILVDNMSQIDMLQKQFIQTVSGLSPTAQKEQERIRDISKSMHDDLFSQSTDPPDAAFWSNDDD